MGPDCSRELWEGAAPARATPTIFSADETTDVSSDSAPPVSDASGPNDGAFSSRVRWVPIDLAETAADLDHLITAAARRGALARQ